MWNTPASVPPVTIATSCSAAVATAPASIGNSASASDGSRSVVVPDTTKTGTVRRTPNCASDAPAPESDSRTSGGPATPLTMLERYDITRTTAAINGESVVTRRTPSPTRFE
jgi:hypothetical protein